MRAVLRLIVLAFLLALAQAGETAAPQRAELKVWNRVLAEFRAPIGFASVQERAERAAERIAALPAEAFVQAIEAKPSTIGQVSGVMFYAGTHFLFGIAEQDLDAASGEIMPAVSQRTVERLRELFAARVESGSRATIVRAAWTTALASLGLVILLLVLRLLSRAMDARLRPERFAGMPRLFGLDLSGAALVVVRGVLRLPFLAAALVGLHTWALLILAAFPYTRPWARGLGAWLWEVAGLIAGGILGALPGLFIVLVIVILTRMATRALAAFFNGVEEGRLQVGWMLPETARATRRIAVVLLWLFAIIVSYPYMPGSSSEAFKGISVFAGLILTLGTTGMVNQVMSGLVVVYARSMRPGDFVQVGDTVGVVVDLGLLATKVRNARQEEVSIPNAVLVGSTVTNFSRHDEQGMVLSANVTIGYDTPWRQVHALLTLAASRTPGLRQAPEPFVVQKALDDFYVAYELRARLERPEDRFRVQSALHAAIQDAFNEHGVQIMSPHFERQPAQAVVVPKGAWAPPPAKPDPA